MATFFGDDNLDHFLPNLFFFFDAAPLIHTEKKKMSVRAVQYLTHQ
jgi:hypothetical protein